MMTQSSGYTGTGLAAVLAGAVLAVSTAWGSVIFQDDFDGTVFDAGVWEGTGWSTPIQTVSGGHLRLSILNDAHRANLVTLRDDFNFYAQPISLEWNIDTTRTLPKPFNYGPSNYRANHSLRITEGSDTTAAHGNAVIVSLAADRDRVAEEPDREFYRIGVARRGGSQLISDGELDGVPSRVIWSLDGQDWTLRLEGAEFVAGDPSERSGTHDRVESHFAQFRVLLSAGGTTDLRTEAYVDSIIVRGPPPPRGTLLTVF